MTFIISIISPIIALITFIFSILSFAKRKNENNKWIFISTCFAALTTLISLLDIKVPNPAIYPLDNAVRRYSDSADVKIETDNIFETYYSIDGSDPKYGTKYEDIFFINSSTTVVAQNRFLLWWSEISENTFVFENLSNDVMYLTPTEEPSPMPTVTPKTEITPTPTLIPTIVPTDEPTPTNEPIPTNTPITTQAPTSVPVNVTEGQNPLEGSNLMTHVNQYRTDAGIPALTWNSNLEQTAQNLASMFAIGGDGVEVDISVEVIGRQCNGAKNAQKAVSDWITGNAYVPSESEKLLNSGYTQIGGALYFLPNGNEYGYHYFWVICLQ